MNNAIELLSRALAAWDNPSMSMEIMFNEIRDYLAAEPEAEPVGLIHSDGTFELLDDEGINFSEPVLLYLRPEPKRKPLTSNERLQGFIELRDKDDGVHLLSFLAGICFAEKNYGIIPRCENS